MPTSAPPLAIPWEPGHGAGRSTQPELSRYHPDSPLWFCFVSCNQPVNEVMAACGNTRPPSKGCCHLSWRWSLRSSCRSHSSPPRPSPARRRGGVRTAHCSILAGAGGSGPTDGGSQARRFDAKGWRHISCCCFLLRSPELMPSRWPQRFPRRSPARRPGGGCGASISNGSRAARALIQPCRRGMASSTNYSRLVFIRDS